MTRGNGGKTVRRAAAAQKAAGRVVGKRSQRWEQRLVTAQIGPGSPRFGGAMRSGSNGPVDTDRLLDLCTRSL